MDSPPTLPTPSPPVDPITEIAACLADPFYFIDSYCQIYDPTPGIAAWVPFKLWREQLRALDTLHANRLTIALKARQLGFSWLVICYALYLMIFEPAATVLMFSKRDNEAIELLAFRMIGVYDRLPAWLRPATTVRNGHELRFDNGSRAMAFPTTGGRSYTGTFVIVDEADFVPDLNNLMNAVKPTIDAGGKLVLVSTIDKSKPLSVFKRIYQGTRSKSNDYAGIFCSWRARPDRDEAWYEAQARDIQTRTGALDDLWQEYPDTPTEALAPKVLDKRIPPAWIERCFKDGAAIPECDLPLEVPPVPGLVVYRVPRLDMRVVCGADPAEGNPNSDDSAATFMDVATGEEVAAFAGKHEPDVFASYIALVCRWYNLAAVMCERNNHGHAVLLWLREHGGMTLLCGHDGNEGWLSSAKGKALLYNECANAFRLQETTLHSFETCVQLSTIEGNTLRAPDGQHDDRADSYALACVGVVEVTKGGFGESTADARESYVASAPRGVFLGDMGSEDE